MTENITYLVDTENVAAKGFLGIKDLPETANVYYFYSQKSYRPSYSEVEELRDVKCKIEFIESAKNGSNALDFQIVSFLGYLIGKSSSHKDKYVLVTNDVGFDAAIEFWVKQGEKVSRKSVIGNYKPIIDEKTNKVIKNDDILLEHAYQQLNNINKKKLNYNKVVTLSSLHLPKDRYAIVLSSIYKSHNENEFKSKISAIPNSQLNEKVKESILDLVEKDFRDFRVLN